MPFVQSRVSGSSDLGFVRDTPGTAGNYWYRLQVWDNEANFVYGLPIGPVEVDPLVLPTSNILFPTSGSIDVSTTPTLSWNAVSKAEKYWILIAADESDLPTDIEADECADCLASIITTSTSYTPSIALSNGTTYYWQVQAFIDSGAETKQGFYTPVSSFSTVIPMVTLTLYTHDGAGGPLISGVSIMGTDASGTPFSETTNVSGYVTITGAAGTWNFTGVKTGYADRTWTQLIDLTGDVHTFM